MKDHELDQLLSNRLEVPSAEGLSDRIIGSIQRMEVAVDEPSSFGWKKPMLAISCLMLLFVVVNYAMPHEMVKPVQVAQLSDAELLTEVIYYPDDTYLF